METLDYQITINAPKKIIWDALVDVNKFKVWSKAFSPNSTFIGTWKEGNEIKFIDEGQGGTVARLDVFKPYDRVVATHIAALTKDQVRETTGEFTDKWIGTKEIYELEETGEKTVFKVQMKCHPDFKEMFKDSWPQALKNLKQLVEA